MLLTYAGMAEPGGQGGTCGAGPVFGRSVNPILRGQSMPTTLLSIYKNDMSNCPPDFGSIEGTALLYLVTNSHFDTIWLQTSFRIW